MGQDDGTDGSLGAPHQHLPPAVPLGLRLVERVLLVEVHLLGALLLESVEQGGIGALDGERLGQATRLHEVRPVPFPAPAVTRAANREQAVSRTRAAGTDLDQEGPVLLGEPDAQLCFQLVDLTFAERVLQREPVSPGTEDIGGSRRLRQFLYLLADARPGSNAHARRVRAGSDIRCTTRTSGTGRAPGAAALSQDGPRSVNGTRSLFPTPLRRTIIGLSPGRHDPSGRRRNAAPPRARATGSVQTRA